MEKKGGKSQRREEKRREKIREEKESSQKTEDAGARKGSKVAKHRVFSMICGSGGSKSRLAKAAEMRDKKIARRCRAKHIWKSTAKAQSQVKMYKTQHSRTTFGS